MESRHWIRLVVMVASLAGSIFLGKEISILIPGITDTLVDYSAKLAE